MSGEVGSIAPKPGGGTSEEYKEIMRRKMDAESMILSSYNNWSRNLEKYIGGKHLDTESVTDINDEIQEEIQSPTPTGTPEETPTPLVTPPTTPKPTSGVLPGIQKLEHIYQELKKLYPDIKTLTYEQLKEFVKKHKLKKAKYLYLCARIAHDDKRFEKKLKGYDNEGNPIWETWCNAYVARVFYLFTGKTDLMNLNVNG